MCSHVQWATDTSHPDLGLHGVSDVFDKAGFCPKVVRFVCAHVVQVQASSFRSIGVKRVVGKERPFGRMFTIEAIEDSVEPLVRPDVF